MILCGRLKWMIPNSNFSEDFSTFSAILNFGGHIGTKYEIFLNLKILARSKYFSRKLLNIKICSIILQ